MNRLFAGFALAALATVAHAQDEDGPTAAERARLRQQRDRVEAEYRAEEKACYGKFGVNDCLSKARGTRRDAVADLRRQEIALNDVQRKRNAAERRRSLDEKNSAQHEKEEGAQPKAGAEDRAIRSSERAAARAAQASSAPGKAAGRDQQVRQHEAELQAATRRRNEAAARSAREHEQRVMEAQERAEKLRKRTAERKKPAASGLQDPP